MSALTILAPGLLGPWPQGDGESLPPPNAPALQRMLARGDRLLQPPLDFEAALARLFGLGAADPPWGALGLWGETGQRPEGFVLRLDPVHLKLGMTDGILFGGPSMRLAMDEARALARSLEAHFSDQGWRITVAAPERWYLQLAESSDLRTAPLSRVLGRHAGLFKPQGADASRWLADLTEAQMLLHSHPVNQAREARGLPVINNLWPWGAGLLPPSPSMGEGLGAGVDGSSWGMVCAEHPLARGLAHAAGWVAHDLPETMDELRGDDHALIVLDDALQPWREGDHDDWLATVEGLEARWFAPLWTAIAQGHVSGLTLDTAEGGVWRFNRA
ncbi:MAG: hypothetical protein FNT29_07040, partial [Halothiobacillaceae bacterium]